MKQNRRKYSPDFETMVTMEALKGGETIAELVIQFDVQPTQINKWKKELVAGAANIFVADCFLQVGIHHFAKYFPRRRWGKLG